MKMQSTSGPSQIQGFMLLEVLIALLIFALGVLGLVGLQANAIKQSSQTKYRADATLLGNDLIGQMWVADRSFAGLSANFASANNGPSYLAWQARVTNALAGSTDYPPIVAIAQVNPLPALLAAGASAPSTGLTSSNQVTITLRWKQPGEPAAGAPHRLVLVTEIK